MKTLYLPLKKEWYEMIERGEKLEEYREFKLFYASRLLSCASDCLRKNCCEDGFAGCPFGPVFKHLDAVCFSYGYTKRRMTFECKGITIGHGRPEWGAPNNDVFIIKLGNRI